MAEADEHLCKIGLESLLSEQSIILVANHSPSGSGWEPRELTWKGRKGLPSKVGTSILSSDDMVTSGWDSEMEDRNWSMSAFCS